MCTHVFAITYSFYWQGLGALSFFSFNWGRGGGGSWALFYEILEATLFFQQIRLLGDKMKNARTHFNMLFVMVITDVALHDVKVS